MKNNFLMYTRGVKWHPLILLILLILPALAGLFPAGFYQSQDGPAHLLRLAHFSQTLFDGQFPVRWIPTLAYGLGTPLFNFNFPLPYYIGSLLLSLGFSTVTSVEILFGASMLLSGIFFYIWMRQHHTFLPAFTGSLFYVWAPYRFLVMYHRAALGEAIAFLFIPLLFLFIDKIFEKPRRMPMIGLTVSYGLLITTHNVTALMTTGILLLYLIFKGLQTRAVQPLLLTIVGLLLSVGLAAFFWLPAVAEVKWTRLPDLATTTFAQHFAPPFALIRSAWEGGSVIDGKTLGMSFQVGLVQILIFLGSVTLVFVKRGSRSHGYPLFWIGLTLLSVFLTLSSSAFLYEHIPGLAYVLYPWRFLGFVVFSIAVLAAWFTTQLPRLFTIALIALLLFANRNHIQTRPYVVTDEELLQPNISAGDMDDEFLPPWADRDIRVTRAREVGQPFQFIETIENSPQKRLRINQYYFPGWEVRVDGKPVNIIVDEENGGRMDVVISSDAKVVDARFHDTPVRSLGNGISLATAGFLGFLLLKKRGS